MDVLHRGYLDGRLSRLAAALLRGFLVFPDSVTRWQEGLLLAAGYRFALILQRRVVGFRRRDRNRRTPLSGFSAHALFNIPRWQKGSFCDRTGPGPVGDLGRLA